MAVAQVFDLVPKVRIFFKIEIAKYLGQSLQEIGFSNPVAANYNLANAGLIKIHFEINEISKMSKGKPVDSHLSADFLSWRTTLALCCHDLTSEASGFCSVNLPRRDASSW